MATHTFTTEQLKKLTAVLCGDDWPKMTDDPRVNYAIDCMVSLHIKDPDPDYDEKRYAQEAETFKFREAARALGF